MRLSDPGRVSVEVMIFLLCSGFLSLQHSHANNLGKLLKHFLKGFAEKQACQWCLHIKSFNIKVLVANNNVQIFIFFSNSG